MRKRTRLIAWILALALIFQIAPAQAAATAQDTSQAENYEPDSVHVETEMIPVEPVTEPMAEPASQSPPEQESVSVPEDPLDPAVAAEDFAWTLEEDVLTITGNGDMPQWNGSSAVPWHSSRAEITTVIIGEGVTSIGQYAFSQCPNLAQITIPDTVVSIGQNAMYECTALASLTLPDGVSTIGYQAFYGCKALTSVVLPSALTAVSERGFQYCSKLTEVVLPDGLTTIGPDAFGYCSRLASITLPEGLTAIGSRAFYSCSALTSVSIPAGVTTISSSAFSNCSGLSSVDIAGDITTIGNSAFKGCSSLTGITLPDTLTTIEGFAFDSCKSLTAIAIPDSVVNLNGYAFQDCSGLTEVSLPANITSIKSNTFLRCSSLTDVPIPDSVTSIEGYAFRDCSALAEVELPEGLESIGDNSFSGCAALTAVELPASLQSIGHDAFANSGLEELTIPGSVTTIKSRAFSATPLKRVVFEDGCTVVAGFSNCTELSEVVLADSIKTISGVAFENCTALTAVELPVSLEKIGASFRCSGLKELTIPGSVRSIDSHAFYDTPLTRVVIEDGCTVAGGFESCDQLTEVILPDSVRTIGSRAFAYCKSLTQIDLPANLTAIGSNAFYNSGLTRIDIPAGITTIESHTFSYCRALTEVILPDTLTKIYQGGFAYCSTLMQLDLPESLTTIDIQAFRESGLTRISIPAGVTTIDSSAFSNCTALAEVTLPDTLTELDYSIFYGCSSLTQIELPESLTAIDSSVFQNCTALERIRIPDGITKVSDQCFSGCTALREVVLPDTLTAIGVEAFQNCDSLQQIEIPEGTSSLSTRAFYSCDALTEIDLPDSITWLGEYVFSYCAALETARFTGNLTEIPNYCFIQCTSLKHVDLEGMTSLTTVGRGAFQNCDQLTSIRLPETVEEIWSYAFYDCDKLSSIHLGSNLKIVYPLTFYSCNSLKHVTLPDTVTTINERAFGGCTKLESIIIPESVTTFHWASFENVPKTMTVYAYPETEAWKFALNKGFNVASLLDGKGVITLTVRDGNGEILTDGYSVNWYGQGSDEIIATGSILIGVDPEQLNYDYEILLGEELVYTHHQPLRTGASELEITHTLEPIGTAAVSGTVTGSDGSVIAGADIEFLLTYAEGYEKTVQIQADDAGVFRAELDAVQVRADFSAEYHFSRSVPFNLQLHPDGCDLGTVVLNRLPGNKITLTLEQQAAAEGTEPVVHSIVGSDLTFTARNLTTGREITELEFQSPWLFPAADQVKPGHRVEITVFDPTGELEPASVVVTLDGNANGSSTLRLTERGGIKLDGISGADRATVLVFGSDGSLTCSASVTGRHTFPHLPAGRYTVVTLADSDLLRSVARIGMLNELGLAAGTDYAQQSIDVSNGWIRSLGTVAVPHLDEEKLFFTEDRNTEMYASRLSIYPGEIILLTVSYQIRADYATSGEKVIIELPEGMELYPFGVMLDKEQIPYTVDGRTVTVSTARRAGTLHFYVSSDELGRMPVSAYLQVVHDGSTVTQPLGTVTPEIIIGELLLQDRVCLERLPVSGITFPGSVVRIYINDELAATTSANAAGSWNTVLALDPKYDTEGYVIHAVMSHERLPEDYATRPRYVRYGTDQIQLMKVLVNMSEYSTNVALTFNFETGSMPRTYIMDGLTNPNITFRVFFNGGDDTTVRNVRVFYKDSDDQTHIVPCTYSGKDSIWIGVVEKGTILTSVGVDYDVVASDESPIISAERIEDMQKIMEDAEARIEEEIDASLKPSPDYSTMTEDELFQELDRLLEELEQATEEIDACFESQVGQTGYEITEHENGEFSYTSPSGSGRFKVEQITGDSLSSLLQDGYEEIPVSDGTTMLYDPDTGSMAIPMNILTPFDVEIPDQPHQETYTHIQNLESIPTSDTVDVRSLLDSVNGAVQSVPEGIMNMISGMSNIFGKYDNAMEKVKEAYQKVQDCKATIAELNKTLSGTDRRVRVGIAEARLRRLSNKLKDAKKLIAFFDSFPLLRKVIPFASTACGYANVLDKGLKMADLLNAMSNCVDDPRAQEIRKDISAWAGSLTLPIVATQIGDKISMAAFTATVGFTTMRALPHAAGAAAAWLASGLLTDKIVGDLEKKANKEYDRLKEKAKTLPCYTPQPDVPDSYNVSPEMRPACDPSGYVYEAVPSNRLEGVKAEAYYLDENGNDILWDASEFDQVNPLYTDAQGRYQWDVPFGLWLVKYSKEGYLSTDSKDDPAANEDGYLPVPPPQLEVNVGMVSTAAPEVQSLNVYQDQIQVIFSQYMKPDSVALRIACGGKTVTGTLEPVNAEFNEEQTEQFASVFAFTPDTELHDSAAVTVFNAVNYAGTEMTADFTQMKAVMVRPTGLSMESGVSLVYGETMELTLRILPSAAGANKTLTVTTSAPGLVDVAEQTVTTDSKGTARIKIVGTLPGQAVVTATLDGTDLECLTMVQVSQIRKEVCAAVTASIPNGSTVDVGTELILTTATEGAEIYYTLDGTCPCVVDSPSRIRYTSPIPLEEDTFLIAYAVKEGFQDSPTAGFLYTVKQKPVNPFADVKEGDFYYDPVLWAVENGITAGATPTTFDPNGKCLRAQVVTFLHRATGSPEPKSTRNPFNDVKPTDFFYKPVLWAVEKNITSGTSATTFGSLDNCNRAAVVTFLWRAAGSPEPRTTKNPFVDVKSGDFFYKPVLWAVENGITAGLDATHFGPTSPCNRAQVVTFLYRAYN